MWLSSDPLNMKYDVGQNIRKVHYITFHKGNELSTFNNFLNYKKIKFYSKYLYVYATDFLHIYATYILERERNF